MEFKLTLIWLGFLGVRLELGEGKINPPCLKLVRMKLETSNLVRKYKDIYSSRTYTSLYQDFINFADVGIFLQKISIFLAKIVLLLKAIVF